MQFDEDILELEEREEREAFAVRINRTSVLFEYKFQGSLAYSVFKNSQCAASKMSILGR